MIPYIFVGSLPIPTYFLVISLSLSFLLVLLSYRVDKFCSRISRGVRYWLLLMASGFFGGRLMHVFYEEWDYYRPHPEQILYFWNGGFVFLGGLISCLITGYLFTKIKKIKFSEWADFFTPLFSLAHAFGRLGCFLAGCCFGSECILPWAYAGRHPTALYLAGGEFLIFLLLLLAEKKQKFHSNGILFVNWLLLHSLMRFYVEFFRDDFRGVFLQIPVFGSLSVSQVISLIIIVGCAVFFFYKFRAKKPASEKPV